MLISKVSSGRSETFIDKSQMFKTITYYITDIYTRCIPCWVWHLHNTVCGFFMFKCRFRPLWDHLVDNKEKGGKRELGAAQERTAAALPTWVGRNMLFLDCTLLTGGIRGQVPITCHSAPSHTMIWIDLGSGYIPLTAFHY